MQSRQDWQKWLTGLPKCELHLHIDGSLQPERLLKLAKKNSVALPYHSVEEIEAAYDFENLQSFLDLYYLGASVLRDEEDFYHLMWDYLLKCREQNIVHTEIMVEPQTYFPQGVSLQTVLSGFESAIQEARKDWGQSALLILSFLRHLSEEEALALLKDVEPYREHFVAIGLASSEMGHPPEKFARLYAQAQGQGYCRIAHAGEEGPPAYVWGALDLLKVHRIDHGVRSSEDQKLMQRLAEEQVPLTVCPLSNIRLCVFPEMKQHNLLQLLDAGLCVTVNSDDPAYFGGYLNENFFALHQDLDLTQEQALRLVQNGFNGSFLPQTEVQRHIQAVDEYSAATA